MFTVIVIGACLVALPSLLVKLEKRYHTHLERKNSIMFFVVNNADRTDPKIVDNYVTWADAVYATRILSRSMPHMSLTIEKV